MPFQSIAADDPRLAQVPDAPGKAMTALQAPAGIRQGPPKGYFIQRSREQRSPDQLASIARRHTLAACGTLPPHMAAKLTRGEQACGKIVADEQLAHGICALSRNEIAARAGVSRKIAKMFMIRIEKLGWIDVTRRPRSGRKHLTNLSKITSPEWLAWLSHGNTRTKAEENCERAKAWLSSRVPKSPPRAQDSKTDKNSPTPIPNKAAAREGGGPS
jgi:hypothetical protein